MRVTRCNVLVAVATLLVAQLCTTSASISEMAPAVGIHGLRGTTTGGCLHGCNGGLCQCGQGANRASFPPRGCRPEASIHVCAAFGARSIHCCDDSSLSRTSFRIPAVVLCLKALTWTIRLAVWPYNSRRQPRPGQRPTPRHRRRRGHRPRVLSALCQEQARGRCPRREQ